VVGVLGPSTKKHTVAGQGFGIGVIFGARQFVELRDLVGILHVRLGQTTPPDLVGKAERPGRMTNGEADQTVTLFFSLASAYSHGSEDGTENPQPSAPLTKITSATHS